MNNQQWRIRAAGQNPTFEFLYGSNFNTTFTTIELFHGGNFTPSPGRDYVRAKVSFVDYVEVHKLSIDLLSNITQSLGYLGEPKFYRIERSFGLDWGLIKLADAGDFEIFFDFVFPSRCNQVHRVYVEMNRNTPIASFPNSLKKADAHIHEKMLLDFVWDHPLASVEDAREYVFEVYGVWIGANQLRPGLALARSYMHAINGDD